MGGNSVAAMPSIHLGVTFAMFLWARLHARSYQWWLLAYTVIMGLALVYLGEHYVSDLLAGGICALLAFRVGKALWLKSAVERTASKG